MSRSPFAWLDGQPHLVVNYDLEPAEDFPPLPELLAGLLRHHDPSHIFLLRPLLAEERRLLEARMHESEIEAWARMVAPEDRLRPRQLRRR